MRILSAILTGLAMVVALSGCGSGDSDSEPTTRQPRKVAALGPFVGECGNVNEEEVRRIGGYAQVSQIYRNAVGCQFRSGAPGSAGATFASYRGSPIERERAWVESKERITESITVDGRSGFASSAMEDRGEVCDFAVQLGDDFFEWSTVVPLDSARGACDVARDLSVLTLQRLQ
ncbi:DUF3558 domain-containing protein [Nocardia sp. NPDC127579]|uniref:DUF3558 domain-containing protein n=1 Tax=Nocardia sp. NPDC127579 TaxID=3345402 RepID=UPI0036433730